TAKTTMSSISRWKIPSCRLIFIGTQAHAAFANIQRLDFCNGMYRRLRYHADCSPVPIDDMASSCRPRDRLLFALLKHNTVLVLIRLAEFFGDHGQVAWFA